VHRDVTDIIGTHTHTHTHTQHEACCRGFLSTRDLRGAALDAGVRALRRSPPFPEQTRSQARTGDLPDGPPALAVSFCRGVKVYDVNLTTRVYTTRRDPQWVLHPAVDSHKGPRWIHDETISTS